jgi:hypothetical protein
MPNQESQVRDNRQFRLTTGRCYLFVEQPMHVDRVVQSCDKTIQMRDNRQRMAKWFQL